MLPYPQIASKRKLPKEAHSAKQAQGATWVGRRVSWRPRGRRLSTFRNSSSWTPPQTASHRFSGTEQPPEPAPWALLRSTYGARGPCQRHRCKFSRTTWTFLPGAATPARTVTHSSAELSQRAEGAESGPAGRTRQTPAGPRGCGPWWRCGSHWGCHTVPDKEKENLVPPPETDAAQPPPEPHSVP